LSYQLVAPFAVFDKEVSMLVPDVCVQMQPAAIGAHEGLNNGADQSIGPGKKINR